MQVDEDLKKAKDTLERMCEGSTSTPKVIILTMCENPRILREVMKLGPNTFVHNSASVEELLSAMRTTDGDPMGERGHGDAPSDAKSQKTGQEKTTLPRGSLRYSSWRLEG